MYEMKENKLEKKIKKISMYGNQKESFPFDFSYRRRVASCEN
jgi:hypothetical protein